MKLKIPPSMVIAVAHSATGKKYSTRQFISLFGISPEITGLAWELMLSNPETIEKEVELKHFLMTLHFLKTYSTETHLSQLFCITEKNI